VDAHALVAGDGAPVEPVRAAWKPLVERSERVLLGAGVAGSVLQPAPPRQRSRDGELSQQFRGMDYHISKRFVYSAR
jgi:hypothetical protein